jgi:hypothetical protein
LQKPQDIWCEHCDIGGGCRIYESRPEECRRFHCGFLTHPDLGEEWRPSASKIVLVAELDGRRLAAHIDKSRPAAWRSEPFYSKLKEWASVAAEDQRQVVVCVGARAIVILPDRDIDLGIIGPDELIVTQERRTPEGTLLEAFKMKRDDPLAVAMGPGTGAFEI